MEPSVYEYPSIFRRVHMEKPGEIEEETEFLQKVWRRHLKKPVRRVLDIASGDSPHGQILAREGMRVVGIDRSPTMIAAGKRGSREAAGVSFYRREINKFTIPERPFDVAFFMSETFPVLITNADLLSHLHSVGTIYYIKAASTVSISTGWIASGWCASASDGNGAKSAPLRRPSR